MTYLCFYAIYELMDEIPQNEKAQWFSTVLFFRMIVHTVGGEGTQANQGVKFNPTIHYVPYEIVLEETSAYLKNISMMH